MMTRRFLFSAAAMTSQLCAQQPVSPHIQIQPAGRIGDASELAFQMLAGDDGAIVRGAPYSGEAVTETIQTLSDGNRIVQKSSTILYRDGEGRTRSEVNPPRPDESVPAFVTINDPVAQVRYTLDSRFKTAQKMVTDTAARDKLRAEMTARLDSMKQRAGAEPNDQALVAAVRERLASASTGSLRPVSLPKGESLGSRNIEGVLATGTRITSVIPAGNIGNEREIVTSTERWYSPELQAIVMTTRSDPRRGETTYRLINLRRGEPSPMLFQVPQDYTITTDRSPLLRPGIEILSH